MKRRTVLSVLAILAACPVLAAEQSASPFVDGRFAWKASQPLIVPDLQADPPQTSIKDPTVVYHNGRWHLFCTVRFATDRPVDMVHISFADWKDANRAPRHILNLHDQYHCAPQVFYFRPHKKWYLIYQMADKNHQPPFGPAFSTTTDLGDPKSWSKPKFMFDNPPEKPKWLDFWVICDDAKAHLFYTSLDGRMWRSESRLADFPHGWSKPELAIQADIFEASHTYKLQGLDKYVTIVEAQGDARRYYKAYLADRLEGPWKPLADSREKPFAGNANVTVEGDWTTNISHGEFLRAGIDERLEVDPSNLRLLFQGASDREYRASGGYGKIPWKLGLLELAK